MSHIFSFIHKKIQALIFFSVKTRSKEERDLLQVYYFISIGSLIIIAICIVYLWHNFSKKYEITFYEKPINYLVLGNFYDGYDEDSIQKLIFHYIDIAETKQMRGNVVEIKGSEMGADDFCKFYGILLEYGAKEKNRVNYNSFYIQSESFFRVSIHNTIEEKEIPEEEIKRSIIEKMKEQGNIYRDISIKKYYPDKIVLEYPTY
ncbi:MAG: hypothetical protein QM536_01760 [Chitinophagaceae bacterium]|nr:hypothetical protein [Chitinophagaceae bacterium]